MIKNIDRSRAKYADATVHNKNYVISLHIMGQIIIEIYLPMNPLSTRCTRPSQKLVATD